MTIVPVIEVGGLLVSLAAFVHVVRIVMRGRIAPSVVLLGALLLIQVLLHACDALEWSGMSPSMADAAGDALRVLVPTLWLVVVFTRNRESLARALHTGEQQLHCVLQAAPVPIVILDRQGRYVDGSDEWSKRLGKNRKELLDAPFCGLDGEAGEILRQAHARALGTDDAVTEPEPRQVIWNDTSQWIRWVARRWKTADEMPDASGVVVLLDFVTEQVLEEERRSLEAERMAHVQRVETIGMLAAGVAHDLSNFLAIITTYAAAAARSKIEPRDALGAISEASESAVRLTKSLSGLARARTARSQLDLSRLIPATAQLLRRALPNEISVQVEAPNEPLVVLADAVDIQQALVNLILNARDAMPAGGELLVKLFRDGSSARIAVKDTGVGIPAAIQAKVFDRFFTTKAPDQGTGLGLALVSEMVERHEGSVRLTSEVGVGTEIVLTFPLSDEAAREPAPSARAS